MFEIKKAVINVIFLIIICVLINCNFSGDSGEKEGEREVCNFITLITVEYFKKPNLTEQDKNDMLFATFLACSDIDLSKYDSGSNY